ncbi:hypothetical protein ACJMK2_007262 [Sinanodonta woodiana]|uniref:Uncharacterized protein n=1 Tax=Sinanodonta woodiana TaxID=1069815 RepID=A0ABD3VJ42_SINWO
MDIVDFKKKIFSALWPLYNGYCRLEKTLFSSLATLQRILSTSEKKHSALWSLYNGYCRLQKKKHSALWPLYNGYCRLQKTPSSSMTALQRILSTSEKKNIFSLMASIQRILSTSENAIQLFGRFTPDIVDFRKKTFSSLAALQRILSTSENTIQLFGRFTTDIVDFRRKKQTFQLYGLYTAHIVDFRIHHSALWPLYNGYCRLQKTPFSSLAALQRILSTSENTIQLFGRFTTDIVDFRKHHSALWPLYNGYCRLQKTPFSSLAALQRI